MITTDQPRCVTACTVQHAAGPDDKLIEVSMSQGGYILEGGHNTRKRKA